MMENKENMDMIKNEELTAKDDLRFRIKMCRFCIKVLEEDCKNDPRQPDALAHYKRQLEELLLMATPKNLGDIVPPIRPPDIVIGLKPAKLFGDIPK